MAAIAAEHDDGVYATAGVHPHDSSQGLDGIEELFDLPQVVAVGEAGLDYHYDHSPRPAQRDVFAAQIADGERPLDAAGDPQPQRLGRDVRDPRSGGNCRSRTVLHCFTGGPDEAQRSALARGDARSRSRGSSRSRADRICATRRRSPRSTELLVETDSPYLAPVPNRGKTEPAGLGAVRGGRGRRGQGTRQWRRSRPRRGRRPPPSTISTPSIEPPAPERPPRRREGSGERSVRPV